MRIGVDGFTFHRHFRQTFHQLEEPGDQWSALQALSHAIELGAEVFSVESFMVSAFPEKGGAQAEELRSAAASAGVRLEWAWGHPDGLGSGVPRPQAGRDLQYHVELATRAGAETMRICTGGPTTRRPRWWFMRDKLTPLLVQAAEQAWASGVLLAVENHGDLYTHELVELVAGIGHPGLGICLDTANSLRMLEDPLLAVRRMAPFARTVHVKDVVAHRGDPREYDFWPSVPIGEGLIDLPAVLAILREHGFDGTLAVQHDFLHPRWGGDPVAVLPQSLAALRACVATSG